MRSPESPRPQAPKPEPQGPTHSPGYQAATRAEAAGVSDIPTADGSKTGYTAPTNDNRQGPFSSSSHPTADKMRSNLGIAVGFVKQGAEVVKKVGEVIDPPEPPPPPTEKQIAAQQDFQDRRADQVRRETEDYHQLTTSGEDQLPSAQPERPFLISEDSVVNPNRIKYRDANN